MIGVVKTKYIYPIVHLSIYLSINPSPFSPYNKYAKSINAPPSLNDVNKTLQFLVDDHKMIREN